MGVLAETAEDLTAAFEALRQAGDREPDHRLALKAVLNELYLVRAYRDGRETNNNRPANRTAYLDRVATTEAGKVTQGIERRRFEQLQTDCVAVDRRGHDPRAST